MKKDYRVHAKNFQIGEMIIRSSGKYEGLIAKIIDKRPHNSLWTTHIKISVDLKQCLFLSDRRVIRSWVKLWQPVLRWKKYIP